MKKVLFKDKPNYNTYGQYNFSNDETNFSFENSTSTPVKYNKFTDKDLYTTVLDSPINKNIIEGDLQYDANSYIIIDKLTIKNSGVNHDVKKVNTYVFLLDNKKLTENSDGIDDVSEMSYSELYKAMFTDNPDSKIYSRIGASFGEGNNIGKILDGSKILSNLYTMGVSNDDDTVTIIDAEYTGDFVHAYADYDVNSSFSDLGVDTAGERIGIFNFDGTQKIHIIVFTSGDADIPWWPDFDRKNRIQVFTIDTANDLDESGEVSLFPFEYGDSLVFEGDDWGAPAWKVTDLKVTINTVKETVNSTYNPLAIYYPITGSVTPPVKIELGANFNSDILSITPYAEIQVTSSLNFRPISEVKIKDTQYDLQTYYRLNKDRQVASIPTEVSLDFTINEFSVIEQAELTPLNDTAHGFLFYVVSWDDKNNKFLEWDDVLRDIPSDQVELAQKQKENLYIYNEVGFSLKNNYITPGIKTIKAVMFAYTTITPNVIELIRWKFITTKIFLDIPINQYPDFAEVGGSDYTTIPWPYTTPIIGGVDKNSKYKNSVRDVLEGGKIGNIDIIDQYFLNSANENNELGQSIQKLDLEQVRYLNKGYGMAELVLGKDILGAFETDSNSNIVARTMENRTYEDGEGLSLEFVSSENNNYIFNLRYSVTAEFVGIQFTISDLPEDDMQIVSDYGGVMGDTSFLTSTSDSTFVAFSLEGEIIPPSDGEILRILELSHMPTGIHEIIISAGGVNQLDIPSEYCYGECPGCTDSEALNYDEFANTDNGTCVYTPIEGCTNPSADNYNSEASIDDGSCVGGGCMDEDADNYDISATYDDESCEYSGCTNAVAWNYNEIFTVDDGSCLHYTPWEMDHSELCGYGHWNYFGNCFPQFGFFCNKDNGVNTQGDCLEGCICSSGSEDAQGSGMWLPGLVNSEFGDLYYGSAGECVCGEDGPATDNITRCNYYGDPVCGENYVCVSQNFDSSPYFNPSTAVDQYWGWCVLPIEYYESGCTDSTAPNYDETANIDDGSCVIEGCTDEFANNYNSDANTDDGTCEYVYYPWDDFDYWDGETQKYPEETSAGEIFIGDNSDSELRKHCKLELNCGSLTEKSIIDSSGNSNKGLLIGDYKIKKQRKGESMRRDSFIKIPKKNDNSNGAL